MWTTTEPTRTVRIPHRYIPRSYQKPFRRAMKSGTKRACLVWHRRAGKEKTCWNWMIQAAIERVGAYYYFFPTNVQARKVLWDGIDREGMRFLDHIPAELLDGPPHETSMRVKLVNGSIIQVIGSDHYDSLRGTNPLGCVFSEFSYQDPQAWQTFRPILAENGGWAVFNCTPYGKNHAYDLWRMARENAEWFTSMLTCRETVRDDGSPVISEAIIAQERAEGMDEEMIQQEYYCSFEGVLVGSYYGAQLRAAESEQRTGRVPWEPRLKVETWWDLGVGDATAIWFTQTHGKEVRCIDYYEASGEGLPHYSKVLSERPYTYQAHHAPHDIEVRELTTGRTRLETADSLGIKFHVVPKHDLADGIEGTRSFFAQCWFDKGKCAKGLDALGAYRKEWDEVRRCFSDRPVHDWASHGADAFRYLAMGHEFPRSAVRSPGQQMAKSYHVAMR